MWICLLQLAIGTPTGFAAYEPAPLAFDLEVVELNLGETDPGHPPEVIAAITVENRSAQTIRLSELQFLAATTFEPEKLGIAEACEVVDVTDMWYGGLH